MTEVLGFFEGTRNNGNGNVKSVKERGMERASGFMRDGLSIQLVLGLRSSVVFIIVIPIFLASGIGVSLMLTCILRHSNICRDCSTARQPERLAKFLALVILDECINTLPAEVANTRCAMKKSKMISAVTVSVWIYK